MSAVTSAAEVLEKEESSQRLGRIVRTHLIQQFKGLLSDAEGVVVARVDRITTRDLNHLRNSLKGMEADFMVVKNSFCRRAFREQGWGSLEQVLEGTSGVSLLRGDPSVICKLLTTFAKDHQGFVLRGGIFKGQVLGPKDVVVIGKLPSREVLLSQLAGMAQAPLRNLLFVLQAPVRSLALIFKGLEGKKKE